MFKKAQKQQSKLRLGIDGPSGSGKTWGALSVATAFGDRIAVIDTECGSASLYSDHFDFEVLELRDDFAPERYIEGIKCAEQAGYDVLVIDSISHEWEGVGGCLDIQNRLGGRYTDWAKVTPRHDKFVNAIVGSSLHIIVTMRSKTDYVVEKTASGKDAVRKVGLAPKQRDGLEYELTAVFNLNQQHLASVGKDRTRLFDGRDFLLDAEVGGQLLAWLDSGVKPVSFADTLAVAGTLAELSAAWDGIPSHRKRDFLAQKEAIKARLLAAESVAKAQEDAPVEMGLPPKGRGKGRRAVADGSV